MNRTEPLPATARRLLGFLVEEFGFHLTTEEARSVRFEWAVAEVTATFDPRGEIELRVAPVDTADPFARLEVGGVVGRASLERVLELLATELRDHQPALRGDLAYFRQLAEKRRADAREWTAYYSRRGPRPGPPRLP